MDRPLNSSQMIRSDGSTLPTNSTQPIEKPIDPVTFPPNNRSDGPNSYKPGVMNKSRLLLRSRTFMPPPTGSVPHINTCTKSEVRSQMKGKRCKHEIHIVTRAAVGSSGIEHLMRSLRGVQSFCIGFGSLRLARQRPYISFRNARATPAYWRWTQVSSSHL